MTEPMMLSDRLRAMKPKLKLTGRKFGAGYWNAYGISRQIVYTWMDYEELKLVWRIGQVLYEMELQ
jgi:hypothetical protein